MTDKQPITEDYKLVESTNNMWIEKGIPLQYLLETRTTSLAEALKKQQQILDGLKALEELEKLKPICDNASKIIIEKIQENQKLKEDLEQCSSFYTDLSKQWKEEVKAHNKSKAEIEELPKYVKALSETHALYENRKLEVSYLQQENQKLKERIKEKEELLDWTINYGEYVIYGLRSEIEELKKFSQGVEFGNAHVMPESSYQFQRQQLQESKQDHEIVTRLEDNIFNELAFHQIFWDCVNDNDVDPNKIEYKLRKKLQSILKGDKK